MKNILVLCTGNSCRSQMAQGYLTLFAKNKATIFSAGIETHGLNPLAVESMAVDGVDISKHTSNNINEYNNIKFDIIVTVCDHAQENCPYIPSENVIRLHKNFMDPSKIIGSKKEIKNAFANTRNEIKSYCSNLIDTYIL